MFNKEIYVKRREKLKATVQSGVLLFLGNDESPMNYKDNTDHFRQDSTFLYYFGISTPGLAAIIDLDENTELICGDEMTVDDIVWMGRLETLAEKASKTGISQIYPSKKLTEFLQKAQLSKRTIHFLPPYRAENKLKLFHLLGVDISQTKELASVEFIKAVVAQRSIKSSEEVEEIEKAVDISVGMQKLAMHISKPGMAEYEIAAAIHQIALGCGGNLAYPIIFTRHGEILHNHNQNNIIKEGDLILNDSGAETAMGYCGDLTRTFPAGKRFTERQKNVYNIVLNALSKASSMLKPGTRFIDVHFTACKALSEGLKDIGLMKGNIEDAVAAGAHTQFFQCGTGHMMGMDVHDMEDLGEQYVGYNDVLKKETQLFGLKSLRLGKELEQGFVVTVEPGIYINPFLIDLWKGENKLTEFINYDKLEEYRYFGGIRIEDNFLITADGAQLLGNPLEKTVEEVEAAREGAF